MKKIGTFVILLAYLLLAGCSKNNADPCENVSCLNGGTCANGTCNCPEGFTGSDCSQEKTPTSMVIKSITVTKFSKTTSNGAGWDLTSGPDLTFVLVNKTKNTSYQHDKYIENVTTTTAKFGNLELTVSPTDRYVIELYDYDLGLTNLIDPDDFMGGIDVSYLWDKGGKFPKKIALDAGGSVGFEFELIYKF